MPSLGSLTKYIGLLSIGKGFIDKAVFQRLLVGVAAVVGLSVIAGIMIGAIYITLLYILYSALVVNTTLGSAWSLAIVGVITVATLALVVCKISQYSKKIAAGSALLTQPSAPTGIITDVINSFIDGFSTPSSQKQQGTQPKPKSSKKPYSVK